MQKRKSEIIRDFDAATPIFAKWSPSESFREIFDKDVLEILDLLKKKDRINILEVGCGHGTWFGVINKSDSSKKIRYTGIDFSKKRIEIAKKKYIKKKNAKFVVSDYLNFKTKRKYNLIFFIEVFQYLQKNDFPKFFKKTRGLLKNQGHIVIIDKETYSIHSLKIYLGKLFRKLPFYYEHVHYPSFNHLEAFGKSIGLKLIKRTKVKEFNAIIFEAKN